MHVMRIAVPTSPADTAAPTRRHAYYKDRCEVAIEKSRNVLLLPEVPGPIGIAKMIPLSGPPRGRMDPGRLM